MGAEIKPAGTGETPPAAVAQLGEGEPRPKGFWPELAAALLKLGCISFGGPIAHLSYLQDDLVRRRRWLDEAAFADLVALCQFLPGPTSSQVVFGIGLRRAGWAGALVASACFTLPSAVLMIGFGYGLMAVGDVARAGWLHGLKLAAAAVVANAIWTMGRKLCPDPARIAIALGGAVTLMLFHGVWPQLLVLVAGAMIGWAGFRQSLPPATPTSRLTSRHGWAAGMLLLLVALLGLLPLLAAVSGWRELAVFDRFFRSGALVFGGGHVVLPLLQAEVVGSGWVSDSAFLAGYGAVQAVPGPLFTFAAYLGTVMGGGPTAWLNGLFCLFAMLLPSWLLVGGMLPLWHLVSDRGSVRAAMRGANATVVGMLLAVWCHPILTSSVSGARDAAALIIGFCLLQIPRVPAWLLVILLAGAGRWLG